MRRYLTIILLLMVAAQASDQLAADFSQGLNQTGTNITSDSVVLAGDGNYTASGTFESRVFDLGSNPSGTISWTSTSPPGTSVLVSSRSGPGAAPDGAWSAWSADYTSGDAITAPTNRYHQYRLRLATTDNSQTPQVSSVIITYDEAGPQLQVASSQNDPLNENTQGAYRFHATINDTVNMSTRQGRYRIGADTYTTYTSLQQSGSYWYIDIPEPTGGWGSRQGETLTINMYIENDNGDSQNQTFTDLIDDVNNPPVLNQVSDTTATESVQKRIFISGSDPDDQPVTFHTSHGTIQTISSNSAYIVWTPLNPDVGNATVTATISDGIDNTSQNITVTVANVNEPPVMRAITSQSGHYGDRIVFNISVAENDTFDNLTYGVIPDLFRITKVTTQGGIRTAEADFVALDDHRGVTNLTFWVEDSGGLRSERNATMDITYCGDNVCQSQENTTACALDCEAKAQTPNYIALELPDRLCSNESFQIRSFEASSRFTCYYEGLTHNNAAFCDPVDGVSISVYRINGSLRTDQGSYTTAANGTLNLTLVRPGSYKLSATAESLIGTTQIVTVQDCDSDISLVDQVVEFKRPQITIDDRRQSSDPELERPELTEESTGLLAIIVWYMLVPLLLAGLLYTSNAYYELHKDTDPRLLKLRLLLWQKRVEWEPKVMPYLDRAKPYVMPMVTTVQARILLPAWSVARPYALKTLKILRRLLRLIQR